MRNPSKANIFFFFFRSRFFLLLSVFNNSANLVEYIYFYENYYECLEVVVLHLSMTEIDIHFYL